MELKGKKILFLGDSITEGVGPSDLEHVYWKLLGKRTGAYCVGYGISGTRIARQRSADEYEAAGNFCDRAAKMEDGADIVVVFGGINDFYHGDAPFGTPEDRTSDTFCGALNVLITTLLEKYPDAVIVFMTPLHTPAEDDHFNGRGIRAAGTLYDYVDAIIDACGCYAVPVLDLFRLSGIQPKVDIIREKYLPDGVHPNDAGNLRIAERLEGFLKSL